LDRSQLTLVNQYEILKKHPEIEQLFGIDYNTKYQCIAFVILQMAICYMVKDSSWWILVPTAWLIGGAFTQALTVANHEITHGFVSLLFGHIHRNS